MTRLTSVRFPSERGWPTAATLPPFHEMNSPLGRVARFPNLRSFVLRDPQAWLIAEKELAANVLNFKIPAAFSLFLAVLLASFFLMAADYHKRMENWSINRLAQSDRLFSGLTSNYQSADNWRSMSAQSIAPEAVIRRPLPLSVLAKGLDTVMERAISISENSLVPPATSISFGNRQEQNRNILLFAPPDFLYVVKVLLSLVALFFTYDALVGEKEAGTLKAMLSGPLRRRSIFVGKWLGASLSVVLPFFLASLFGLLYLTTIQQISFETVQWARILMVLGASVLYCFVFTSLGLLVSAATSTQKQAIAVSLSVWVLLALVLPNLSVLAAERAQPIPSLSEHQARVLVLARQIEDEEERAHPGEGYNFPGYGLMHEGAAPRIRQIVRQADDAYIAQRMEQDRLARRLARFSPASSFTYAVTDLAGTGVTEFQSYMAKLQQARDRAIQLNDEKQTSIDIDMKTEEGRSAMQARMKEFFEKTKQLRAQLHESLLAPRSPAQAMRDSLADIGLLMLWSAATMVGAVFALNRADVR